MSTYRLSPLEELRLEKERVKEERTIANQRLSYQLQYLNDNWGTLLTKGLTSSVKTKFAETMDNLSNGSSSSMTPFVTKRTNPWLNMVFSSLPLIGSIAWKIAKPALITYVLKKGSTLFFGKIKKKFKS